MRDERLKHGPAPISVNFVAGRSVEVEEALHIFRSQSIPSTLFTFPVRAQARGGAIPVWKSTSELDYPEKHRIDGVGRPKFDFHTV